MAKGGINLNPGADATLTAAAYRAGMANVPKDLSGTFEAMAKSYDDTMQSVAESWSTVIEKVVPLAEQMVKTAIKRRGQEKDLRGIIKPAKYGEEGVLSEEEWTKMNKGEGPGQTVWEEGAPAVYNDDGSVAREAIPPKTEWQGSADTGDVGTYAEYLDSLGEEMSIHDMFTNIRNEQKSLWGKNDPKSKERKLELKAEKKQIYNELDSLDAADTANTELLASGNFDEAASGQINTVMAAAIQAYNSKSGRITKGEYKGYHVTLGKDENDEFTFTLRNGKGDFVTYETPEGNLDTGIWSKNAKPYKVTSSGISNLLVPKYDEAKYEKLNKLMNDTLSKSKVQDYSKVNFRNQVTSFVSNEADLFGLMNKALGANKLSFVEELNTPSVTSAEYFASLGEVKLRKLGVVDADADGDIDKDDLFTNKGGRMTAFTTNKNYTKVKSALLNKSDANYSFRQTQGAFLTHADKVGENMHNFTPTSRTTTTPTTANPFGQKSIAFVPEKGTTQYKTPTQALADRDAILSGIRFEGIYGDYVPVQGGFNLNGEFISTYDALTQEKVNLAGDRPVASSRGSVSAGGGNPFGETKANRAPADFVTAVGKDDKDVVTYLESMGITVKNKLGDNVEVEINGKTKTFTVDPNVASDEARANEMWKWMFENWNKKKLK